jgi:flagellar protein FliL
MSNDKEKAASKKGEEKPKTEGAEGEESTAPAPKGRFAFLTGLLNLPRKTMLFVVAPAVLAVVLSVGAYFFLFTGEEPAVAEGAHGEAAVHAAEALHPVFFEVPDILVNVSAGGEKPAFLKLSVSLELESEEARAAVEPVVARVVDQLQTYLRELRVEDLSGSAAMFRLKEELLRRVNLAVEPAVVKDVLFREMIVQ